jgi:glycosyltransferase involved in cell wall biosynthesis
MSLGLLATLARSELPLVYVVGDEWLGYGPRMDAWTSAWRGHPRAGAVLTAVTSVPTLVPPLPETGMFCFVSDWLRRRAELAVGSEFDRAQIVPPGIDPVDFPIAGPSPDRPWRHRLLCVGRVEPRKGFRTAVESLPLLPDGRLAIVGPDEGGYDAQLRAIAVGVGVADRIERRAGPRAALAAEYAAADAVLFTSVWDEPFGLVPLEAMASGTPVVATGTGGSAEFLRHEENCLLVPRGEPAALAAAVERLAADASLRNRLRAGGARTAIRYSADTYATTLEAIHLAAVA